MNRKECQKMMSELTETEIHSCKECPDLVACYEWGQEQKELNIIAEL